MKTTLLDLNDPHCIPGLILEQGPELIIHPPTYLTDQRAPVPGDTTVYRDPHSPTDIDRKQQ